MGNPSMSLVLTTVIISVLAWSAQAEVRLSKHPVVIVLSYDGFRNDYMDKTYTPNLHLMEHRGVSVHHMDNQFATFTFPNHHSIATGLFIESHGIVANSFYDPLYGRKLDGKKGDAGFWNYSSSVMPLYAVNELAGDGRVSGVSMWPGSDQPWGKKNTKATYIQRFDQSISYDRRIDQVISWITDKTKPANLVFAYFGQPDGEGHDHGPESPQVINAIQRMDELTGYLIKKLEGLSIMDKVNLVFLSDHGMQQIRPWRRINYKSIVDTSLYEKYGSTPVNHILPKDLSRTEEVYRKFKTAGPDNHFSTYRKTDIAARKPHWHYSNCRRIMPILIVADDKWAFADAGNNVDEITGGHGFDNENPAMWPYFIAHGPVFKARSKVDVFSNVDLYPLICRIMKMDAPANNGTLAKSLPLLRN